MRTALSALVLLLAPCSVYATQYAKVAVVAKAGGDYTDPVAAIDEISSWCGTPTAANPCLIKIMPGIYDLAEGFTFDRYLSMRSYVDVEGSGADVTTIKTTSGAAQAATVAFNYVSSSELRSLAVECANWGVYSSSSSFALRDLTIKATSVESGLTVGVSVSANAPVRDAILDRVIVIASGPGRSNTAVFSELAVNLTISNSVLSASGAHEVYAVRTKSARYYGAETRIVNTKISASGAAVCKYGVMSEYGTTTLANVQVSVQGTFGCSPAVGNGNALNGSRGVVRIDASQLSGPQTVWNNGDAYIGATRLDGPTPGGQGGYVRCAQSYDGNYAELDRACLPVP